MKTFNETDSLFIFNRETGDLREEKITNKTKSLQNWRQVLNLELSNTTYSVLINSSIGYTQSEILCTTSQQIGLELKANLDQAEKRYNKALGEYKSFINALS